MTARIAEGAAVTSVDARAPGDAAAADPAVRPGARQGDRRRHDRAVPAAAPAAAAAAPAAPALDSPPGHGRDRSLVLRRSSRSPLLLHVAFVVYLRQVDWPRRPSLEEVPDRFIRQIVRAPRPTPPPAAPTTVAVQDTEAAAPRPRPAASAPRPAPAETRPDSRPRSGSIGLIPLLTARGADGSAALPDVLADGAVDRSLDEALRGVGGVRIAGNDALRGLPAPAPEPAKS